MLRLNWVSNEVEIFVCVFFPVYLVHGAYLFSYLFPVDPTKIKRITRKRRYPEAEEYQRRMVQEQLKQTFDNLVAESQKNMEAVILENTGGNN